MTALDTFANSHDTARNRESAVVQRDLGGMPALLDHVSSEVAALGGPTTTAGRVAASVPENTRRVLDRVARHFASWCTQVDKSALPASASTVADYLNYRCNLGLLDRDGNPVGGMLSPQSLRQILFGIRRMHAAAGLKGLPETADAIAVIRFHEQQWVEAGGYEGQATPLVGKNLLPCLETLSSDTFTGLRDRALLVLGFAGFLRRSELARLRLSDVRRTDEGLTLRIRRSKTGVGQTVDLLRGQSAPTDPRRTFAQLADAVRDHGDLPSDHLFWRRDRWGNLPAPLSNQSVSFIVKDAVTAAGLDDPNSYSGHSLRAGGATTAYASGVAIDVIRRHGRWAQGSTAMFRYFRAVDRWRDNASGGLGL